MTERRNNYDSLEPGRLREPPAIFWPGYFWVMNDRMEERELMRQLRDMHAHGARSLCLLPAPPEMRPDILNYAMFPPYLSKAYFEMLRKIVAECERLGINYWLYDEGGWPSGSAAGQVFARDPKSYARQVVAWYESRFGCDEKYTVPPEVLCAAIRTPEGWKSFFAGQTIRGLSGDSVFRVYYVKNFDERCANPPYANLLSPKAVETFIRITHERLAEHLSRWFGGTIRFAFTDEPSMIYSNTEQLTWTSDFREKFLELKGYDILQHLPCLFEPAGGKDDEPRVRVDYFDVRSRLFVERYLLPLRDWCRRHNLLSGGHFGGEDDPKGNVIYGYGHILRSLRALDLPAVDAIWRQLFPGKRSHHFVKYASSVGRQMQQPLVMTESYAVYGSGLTLAEMKWALDQQYVRGATMLVCSNYPYSTREHFMVGCRPHFGQYHPLWKYFNSFHQYAARLGYLLSRGQPLCNAAVYYDVRSIWAGGKTGEQAVERHDRLAETLLQSQCEFDFLDDDILAGEGSRMENGCLAVGPMRYDKLLVPATDWMDEKALAGAAEFVRRGGALIILDGLLAANGGKVGLPGDLSAAANGGSGQGRVIRTTIDQAAKLVEPVARLTPACDAIRACGRRGNGFSVYFLTNQDARTIHVQGLFREETMPCLCDPVTGELTQFPAVRTSEGVILDLDFPPWGSRAIIFGIKADKTWQGFDVANSLELAAGWTLRPFRQYAIGEHNYEITEPDASPFPCELGDWRKALGPWFSGDAQYAVEFECAAEQAQQPARLDLGCVRYACEVEINGRSAGQLIWPPFELELTGLLRSGKNSLKITVTNTLANALFDPRVVESWENKKKLPGWTGYDTITRKLESDNQESGLFGPARICFGNFRKKSRNVES